MKRISAFVLAMLLVLCAGVAQAEWTEGTSPSKPYMGLPEVDLDAQLGYMMFFPSEDMAEENACQKLFIYLPREDVKAGEGTFYLINEADGVIFQTAMNNEEAVTVRPLTDDELVSLVWGGGSCLEIKLPVSLTLGKKYFVNMTENCVVSEGGVSNAQLGGTDAWSFTVEGEYGASAMEYRRVKEDGTYEGALLTPKAGDQIRFDLVLGGEAVKAAIYGHNDSVDFHVTVFEESCEVVGEVMSDVPAWGVMFLDEEGNELNRVEFR